MTDKSSPKIPELLARIDALEGSLELFDEGLKADLATLREELKELDQWNHEEPPFEYRWGMYAGDSLYEPLRNLYIRNLYLGFASPTKAKWQSLRPSSHRLLQGNGNIRWRVEYADRVSARPVHNRPRLPRYPSAPCNQKVKDANQPSTTLDSSSFRKLVVANTSQQRLLLNKIRARQANEFSEFRAPQRKFFAQKFAS